MNETERGFTEVNRAKESLCLRSNNPVRGETKLNFPEVSKMCAEGKNPSFSRVVVERHNRITTVSYGITYVLIGGYNYALFLAQAKQPSVRNNWDF